jgi:hypothetical protein
MVGWEFSIQLSCSYEWIDYICEWSIPHMEIGHMNRTWRWMKLWSRIELSTNMWLVVYLCEMTTNKDDELLTNMDEFWNSKKWNWPQGCNIWMKLMTQRNYYDGGRKFMFMKKSLPHGHFRWILINDLFFKITWSYSCKVIKMANVEYHMNEILTWMKLSGWWTAYLCAIMRLLVCARKPPAHQLCLVTSKSTQVTEYSQGVCMSRRVTEHSLNTYPPQLHLITLVTAESNQVTEYHQGGYDRYRLQTTLHNLGNVVVVI